MHSNKLPNSSYWSLTRLPTDRQPSKKTDDIFLRQRLRLQSSQRNKSVTYFRVPPYAIGHP